MKQGQKPAEPRMEDVLASIRRAIDENAAGMPPDRFGGSMAELRVKVDASPAPQQSRQKRDFDYAPASGPQQQGFAGILGGRRGFEPTRPEPEPPQRRPDPIVSPRGDEGQYVYDGYYGAQVADYTEAPVEPYEQAPQVSPQRYLPPAQVSDHRQSFAEPGLLSESSSDATQAAFNHLAETIARRALGDRPIADITQELLRGMLKQWLDDNLPTIVERLVREEIERVVRRPQR